MNYVNTQPDIFNYYTRGSPDTFRQLGYLSPSEGINNMNTILILYGRAKYPNSDIGEFYATTSDKISDLKIPIDDKNSNIKRITDIPNIVNISGKIFNGKYEFVELPKADLRYPYI